LAVTTETVLGVATPVTFAGGGGTTVDDAGEDPPLHAASSPLARAAQARRDKVLEVIEYSVVVAGTAT